MKNIFSSTSLILHDRNISLEIYNLLKYFLKRLFYLFIFRDGKNEAKKMKR